MAIYKINQYQGVLKPKSAIASDWMDGNPILRQGEIGVELDTYKFKIGDGVSQWLALPYGMLGTNGKDGTNGYAGANGTNGLDGVDGLDGDVGTSGDFNYLSASGLQPTSSIDLLDISPMVDSDKFASRKSLSYGVMRQIISGSGGSFLGRNVFKKASYTAHITNTLASLINVDITKAKNIYVNDTTGSKTVFFQGETPGGFSKFQVLIINLSDFSSILWPNNILWPAGTSPALYRNSMQAITFVTFDNGTTWFGYPEAKTQ